MTPRLREWVLKLAYGLLFVGVLPALLVRWAWRLDRWVQLPVPHTAWAGAGLVAAGMALMTAGTLALWRYGNGLPMSAFPPERLVARGVYRLVADPLYVGAVAMAFGTSLVFTSPGGLWIVSPVFALACVAWVMGFERERTRARFGAVAEPLLRLPGNVHDAPSPWHRAAIYVLVFIPWLVIYLAVEFLGAPAGAPSSSLPIDDAIPVMPWTALIYESVYPMVVLAPLFARRQRDLRRFARRGLWAIAIIIPFYLIVPIVYEPRPIPGTGFFQAWLGLERAINSPLTAFPAFHMVWACIAASLYAATYRRGWLMWLLAAAIGVSCATVGIHALADVIAAVVVFALLVRGPALWEWLRVTAEQGANSWREWRIGPLRLMSHGLFIGVAVALSYPVSIWLGGADLLWWVFAISLVGAILAALWAQLIEGSPQLLRPFGYFGGMIGVLGTVGAASFLGLDGWRLLAATSVTLAFGQGLGRLRCLVNGCCHGAPAASSVGITYVHPMPRPSRLAGLGGVAIHPTQIYSLLWLLVVGVVLVRLWLLQAPLAFIAGMYFVLVGLGRFVEEHYRGEPQTAVLAGFRLYQWLTFAFIIGGAALTTCESAPAPLPSTLDWRAFAVSLLAAAIGTVSFGMDVPGSNRRFSRLA
ncbi:MAG TPA: prolipoprotein diacylglyceryl transferase family protein [Gemmatimonadaceae bacterium]|jgi:prolipoprotein diacylglyceryltransferase/protein-S-isoprenylcysteine O-methyltransferase Ste14